VASIACTRQGHSRTDPTCLGGTGQSLVLPERHSSLRSARRIFSYIRSRNIIENKGQKSAPNKLLKIKGPREKDVKNEDCSQWLIENKGAKKVLRMSY
jgi:hypothetical protein